MIAFYARFSPTSTPLRIEITSRNLDESRNLRHHPGEKRKRFMPGIRDYLFAMDAGAANMEAAARMAADLRKSIDQDRYIEGLPDAMSRNDIGYLMKGMARNDPGGFSDVLKQMLPKQPDPNKMAFNKQQLLDQGIPADKADAFSKFPQALQAPAVANYLKVSSDSIKKNENDLHNQDAQRRQRQEVQTQRGAFTSNFDKTESTLIEEKRQIDRMTNAIKNGDTTSDGVLLNFIARAVAGEKGPLTEGDIERIKNSVFENKLERWNNFLTGGTTSTLSPKQRETFAKIIDQVRGNFSQYQDEKLGSAFGRSLSDHPMLFDGDKPDNSIIVRAKKYGYQFKDGRFEKGTSTSEYTGPAAELAVGISQIKDPTAREELKQRLDARIASGGLDDAWIGKLRAHINRLARQSISQENSTDFQGDAEDLVRMAGAIQDESVRSALMDKIRNWNGKSMSPAVKQAYLNEIKKRLAVGANTASGATGSDDDLIRAANGISDPKKRNYAIQAIAHFHSQGKPISDFTRQAILREATQ